MKAIREFIEAFDVQLGDRVPGKGLEIHPWPDHRYEFLLRSNYPALYRAVVRELATQKAASDA